MIGIGETGGADGENEGGNEKKQKKRNQDGENGVRDRTRPKDFYKVIDEAFERGEIRRGITPPLLPLPPLPSFLSQFSFSLYSLLRPSSSPSISHVRKV